MLRTQWKPQACRPGQEVSSQHLHQHPKAQPKIIEAMRCDANNSIQHHANGKWLHRSPAPIVTCEASAIVAALTNNRSHSKANR